MQILYYQISSGTKQEPCLSCIKTCTPAFLLLPSPPSVFLLPHPPHPLPPPTGSQSHPPHPCRASSSQPRGQAGAALGVPGPHRAALTPQRMLAATWIRGGKVLEAERLPAICSSLFVFSSREGGGKRREKEREGRKRRGPLLRCPLAAQERGGRRGEGPRSLARFFFSKAGSLFANQ